MVGLHGNGSPAEVNKYPIIVALILRALTVIVSS